MLEDCEAIMYFLHCRNIDPEGLLSQLEPWQDQIILHNTLSMPGGDHFEMDGNTPPNWQRVRWMREGGRKGWRYSPRLQITMPGDVKLHLEDLLHYSSYLYENTIVFYGIRFKCRGEKEAMAFFDVYPNASIDSLESTPYYKINRKKTQREAMSGSGLTWIEWQKDLLTDELTDAAGVAWRFNVITDRGEEIESLNIMKVTPDEPVCMHLGTGECPMKAARRHCSGNDRQSDKCQLYQTSVEMLRSLSNLTFERFADVKWQSEHTILVHHMNAYASMIGKRLSDEYMEVVSEGTAEEYPLHQERNDLSSNQSL